jgi:hypothetical protein
MDAIKAMGDRAKAAVGGAGQPEEESGIMSSVEEQFNGCCDLSRKQRIYGWLACMLLGGFLEFLSSVFFWGGKRHISQFAITYSLGNVCSIGSSCFFVGPAKLLKVMFEEQRKTSAIIYLSCLSATIAIAVEFPHLVVLLIAVMVVQYGALVWYGLSFVPFGRTLFCKCFKKASETAYNQITEQV